MPMVIKMQREISKSAFKAHALEVMRGVEQTGEDVVITAHGKPTLVVKKLYEKKQNPLDKLRGSVVDFDSPTAPVSEDEWELA